MASLMAVDVGMNALGYAYWYDANTKRPTQPDAAGVVKVPSKIVKSTGEGTDWVQRFDNLIQDQFSRIFYDWQPARIGLEWAEFRSGNAVGMAAAARNNLTQLAFAAGYHTALAHLAPWKCEVELIPVSTWKGMLKKELVQSRLENKFGSLKDKRGDHIMSHAIDALGIGLFMQGHKIDNARWFG